MTKQLCLLSAITMCVIGTPGSTAIGQTDPDCIYPQWLWGQTGPISHYYSEYVFMTGSIGMEKHNCSLSYWDNYDSTDGGLTTSEGCTLGADDCDPGGIGTFIADRPAKGMLLLALKPKPGETGSKALDSGGYPGSKLAHTIKITTNPGRVPTESAVGQREMFVGIEFIKERVSYFKLFQTAVAGFRRDVVGGKPVYSVPYPITAFTGVEVTDLTDKTEPKSADVPKIPFADLDKYVTWIDGSTKKSFLLGFGRHTYVVRRHGP